ncbi:MAG: hypothetical protein H0X36_01500 [Sphingomonadaceae bacterium]|nr:hypothetical protein [Sphingomonadaceae bacterium]
MRWYSGLGDDADHRASVTLVVAARDRHQWLVCDCLGEDLPPPLISPAYLSIAETYYLRRLTSAKLDRPEHEDNCPFFRPQAPHRLRDAGNSELTEISHPDRLFNAHRLAPEKLAQVPDDEEPDDRSRGVAIPRLARLLWWLLERAQLDELAPLPADGPFHPSIRDQFAALGRATQALEIAPGVPLAKHIYFHPKALTSNRIYASLRQSVNDWPAGFAPQAFLVTYASSIHGETITTADGDIEIRNRIQYATMNTHAVGGPYLTITVIGEHSKAEGYRPLRAYAQPILAGNRFLAVHAREERIAIEQLITLQYRLRRMNVSLTAKKPLFNILTKRGPIRPDMLVAAFDGDTGEEREWALQVIADNRPQYALMRDNERKQLAPLGRVIALSAEDLQQHVLKREILADLGRS